MCRNIELYLNKPMDRYEYMKLPSGIPPQEIINKYNLTAIAKNFKVYIKIRKGMCSLPKSGRLAHDRLKNHLEKHGYQPVKFTPNSGPINTDPYLSP